MRALLVSKEFAPYSPSGGIGTYTQTLAPALAAAGVETHVLCVHPGLPRRSERVDGFTVHTGPVLQPRGLGRLSGLPAAYGRFWHAASVWREYRRLRVAFDVVEAPELYAESLFIALRGRVPLVVRMHSSAAQLFPWLGRGGRDLRATVALENAAIHRADIVVSTAPNLARTSAELGLDDRFTRAIIYPVRRRELAAGAGMPGRVLFVGRLEPLKNPDVLLAAAPLVLERVPDARFRFVGSDTFVPRFGSHRATLEATARELGVQDAIEFAGELPHDQVFEEMAAAAVCAFPSRTETFGNVVAEAASIGRPAVVSDIPAFNDFVTDGVSGRIAPPQDPAAWADALVGLLQAPEQAQRMALALRDEIIRRADPNVVAELVIESHEAAIARRASR